MKMPTNAFSTLIIIAGLLIWASSFIVLYAALSLGCIYSWPTTFIRASLLILWFAHLLGLTALLVWSWRRLQRTATAGHHRFAWYATVLVAGVGLVGTAWTGLPILAVTPCL